MTVLEAEFRATFRPRIEPFYKFIPKLVTTTRIDLH